MGVLTDTSRSNTAIHESNNAEIVHMRSFLLIVLLSFLVLPLAAQPASTDGRVGGTVFDHLSGDPLIGATVLIEGTTLGAATDIAGKYLIRNVPAGTYSVRISYIGYDAKRVTEVVVTAGELTKVDATLEEQSLKADEVVVTARALRSTESTVLSMRRNSATIGDGISAEMIKRVPDATSADALKRVVGVSIMDNKYVLVRGVSDRYNQTTLNGASMNSTDTESDKRSFSFDMIPSNLLDNTVVVKTATPDKPGDFTGGLVELKTMDFPDRQLIKLSLGTSMNTMTTGRSVATGAGGSTDWLGMDDGIRNAPPLGLDGYSEWQGLPNTWKNGSVVAPLNQSLSFAFGDHYFFDGVDVGAVAALSYKGGYTRTETHQDFVIGSGPFRMDGPNDEYSVLWGGIADLHAKFGEGRHKLSMRNAYNRTADEKIQERSGIDFQGREVRSISTQWIERSLYNGQLSGEHNFGLIDGMLFDWKWSYGATDATEPDRRKLKYQRQSGDTGPFSVTGTENNERAWTKLAEFSRGGGWNIEVPIATVKLKAGGAFESSNRRYQVRFTSAEFLGSDFSRTFLPADSIFLPENFGPGQWIVRNLSSRSDEYDADRRVFAAYAMADVPFAVFGERFRLVGGARWEDARLRAFTYLPAYENGSPTFVQDTARLQNADLLPSFNLTYVINEITNLRFAYSNSVNRPELREIANVSYYDFVNYEEVRGNPSLHRAWVENYDSRFEFYPNVGEILAVSVFYKRITDAIEQQVVWSSNPGKQFINTPMAENYGMELEVRKSLAFLNEWMERFSVTGNYSRIISKVQFSEVRIVGLTPDFVPIKETFTDIRSMQGQASYTLNGGLHFTEMGWGTSISLMYNRFGGRVDAIADIRDEDIYELPRGTVDVSITQKLTPSLEVKLSGHDVGSSVRRYEFRTGQMFKNLVVGASYGLSFSYAF